MWSGCSVGTQPHVTTPAGGHRPHLPPAIPPIPPPRHAGEPRSTGLSPACNLIQGGGQLREPSRPPAPRRRLTAISTATGTHSRAGMHTGTATARLHARTRTQTGTGLQTATARLQTGTGLQSSTTGVKPHTGTGLHTGTGAPGKAQRWCEPPWHCYTLPCAEGSAAVTNSPTRSQLYISP